MVSEGQRMSVFFTVEFPETATPGQSCIITGTVRPGEGVEALAEVKGVKQKRKATPKNQRWKSGAVGIVDADGNFTIDLTIPICSRPLKGFLIHVLVQSGKTGQNRKTTSYPYPLPN